MILLFEKININNTLVKQETLDESIFYNPTKEISAFIYPKIEEWYEDFSSKSKTENTEKNN